MHVHPAIAALRDACVSQRHHGTQGPASAAVNNASAVQTAHEAWFASPRVQAVIEALGRYGAGASLEACPALGRCLCDYGAARELVAPMIEGLVRALTRDPLSEAPFRFKVSHGLATIQLLAARGATLGLSAYEPIANTQTADTALFSDREVHEIVLSRVARGVVHTRIGAGRIATQKRVWRAGETLSVNASTQARQIHKVERSALLLQLTREPARPRPTRLVSLTSGETLRTASGDKSASQAVMALGVLGALGERGAISVMQETALNREEDPDVRWEAARQTLGLEPERGLKVLERLSEWSEDPLAEPARALRSQLLEAQPELRVLLREEAV
ncbi:MAG: hypothetical protein AAF291_10355 [Pseudomonadota bacterium]